MWDMGDSEGIPYPNDLDGRVVDRFSVDVVVGKKHKKFSSLQALHFGQRLKQIGPLGALGACRCWPGCGAPSHPSQPAHHHR
jgi:hypothetical protein